MTLNRLQNDIKEREGELIMISLQNVLLTEGESC